MTTFADTGFRYSTPLTINSRERVVRSETLNLKVQAVDNDSQRWDLVITLEPSSDKSDGTEGSKLGIHRVIHGLHTSFTTKMPQYLGISVESGVTLAIEDTFPAWDSSTNYTVADLVTHSSKNWRALTDNDNSEPASDNTDWADADDINDSGQQYLAVDASAAVTIPNGLFITVAGDTKVYMVETGASVPETGQKAIKIFPPLLITADDGDAIIDEPDITVYYAADGVEGTTVTDGVVTRATVSLVEALA